MKMFTTIAVATAFLGLAACSKNESVPAPVAPVEAPAATEAAGPAADQALATANATETAPAEAVGGSVKPAEGGVEQPK